MLILPVILLILSTLILVTMPITFDKIIKDKEKDLDKVIENQNQVIIEIKNSSYTGQGFAILQNQIKILQEINPKSSKGRSLIQELITSKKQISATALNTVQLTGLITQKEYNDYNNRINAPFDLSKFHESSDKLDTIHQELLKKIESGLISLNSQKNDKELGLAKTKKIKSILIIIAVLLNSFSIMIGAYISISEKNKPKIELEIKNIRTEVQSGFQKTNSKLNELKISVDSLNTLNPQINILLDKNTIFRFVMRNFV